MEHEPQYRPAEDLFANPPRLRSLELQCPDCNAPIHGKQINIDTSLAHCNSCGNTFQLEREPERGKPEIFMPADFDVLRLRNELDIEFKWRRSLNGFLTFFTLVWNSILFIIASTIILSGSWGMLLFLGLHGSVGIGLLYHTVTTLFNRTNVLVDRDYLRIEHRPLPLPFYPNKAIPIQDIKQVFVERYTAGKTNDVPVYSFALRLIQRNGKRLRLVQGLKHAEQAQYLEQEIEYFLQIDDKKVLGEWEGHVLDR